MTTTSRLTAEELTQMKADIKEELREEMKVALLIKTQPKPNYGRKFGKVVESWLERRGTDKIRHAECKNAIYTAVKASLEIKRLADLTEETYDQAVWVFEQQKLFFKKRVFAVTKDEIEQEEEQ